MLHISTAYAGGARAARTQQVQRHLSEAALRGAAACTAHINTGWRRHPRLPRPPQQASAATQLAASAGGTLRRFGGAGTLRTLRSKQPQLPVKRVCRCRCTSVSKSAAVSQLRKHATKDLLHNNVCKAGSCAPWTLMRSFLAMLLLVRKVDAFLRWSPCSWMTCPSSVSSTIVPLQQNSARRAPSKPMRR